MKKLGIPSQGFPFAGPTRASRRLLGIVLVLVGLSWTSGESARAAIRVYADRPGVPRALPAGTSTLPVFVTNGTSATTGGSACLDGNGDELCGFSLTLQASGGIEILAFAPEAPASTLSRLQPGSLRVNGISAITGRLGAERIGTLTVDVSGAGELRVVADSTSTVVSANLELRPIPETLVALPEPSIASAILASASMLALIASSARRPRRGRGR